MPEFVKDVIKPGVYHADGKNVEVFKADINRWVENFNAMKEANLLVPVPWEHPPTSDPEGRPVDATDKKLLKKRERSRLNAGWVKEFFVDDGVLKARIDIPRKEDAQKIDEVGTFVSPQFGPWTDGNGRKWKNSISHLALTVRPVNADQSKKFEKVAASKFTTMLSLSLADVVQFADHDDTTPIPDPEAEESENETPVVPGQKSQPDDATKRLRELLASIGVVLPEGTKLGGDLAILVAAIESHLATKQKMKEEAAAESNNNPGQNVSPVEEEPSTISMASDDDDDDDDDDKSAASKLKTALGTLGLSVNDGSALGDDTEFLADLLGSITRHIEFRERRRKERKERKADGPLEFSLGDDEVSNAQLTQMSVKLDAMNTELTASKQEKYRDQIDDLFSSGRIDGAAKEKLTSLTEQYQFSLESNQSSSELSILLGVYSSNPAGTHWTDEEKIQRFSVEEEQGNRPFFTGDEDVDDDRADEIVDEMHRHLVKAQ